MDLRRAATLLSMAALAGCGGGEPRAVGEARAPALPPPTPGAAVARQAFVRGMVRLTPNLSFRSCDGTAMVATLDSTSDHLVPAYRVLRPATDEIYVEAVGTTAQGQPLVLRRLEYAALPGPGGGCQGRGGHLVQAFGIRPEWRLLVWAGGMELTQTGESALNFPAATAVDSGGMKRYEAGGLRLSLIDSPCTVDSLRTFGSMQAIVDVGGKTLRGCAANGIVR
jgi:uncharacterized membrane protein